MLLTLAFVQKENIPAVEASSSIRQGDLVLNGNNVTRIEGRFDVNGSIIVEENATLILKNAIINFTQTYNWQHNMTFRNPSNGNPRLQAENVTITASNYYFDVKSYANSTATAYKLETAEKMSLDAYDSTVISISNSTIEECLYAGGSSAVNVSESTFTGLWGGSSSTVTVSNCTISSHLVAQDSSVFNISNSTIRQLYVWSGSVDCHVFGLGPGFFGFWNYSLDCSVVVAPSGWAPEVTLKDSQIEDWIFDFWGSSNATITNSTIEALETISSSVATASNSIINWLTTRDDTVVWLINSTCSSYYKYDNSKIYICWYLDVHVIDSIGQNVPGANVRVVSRYDGEKSVVKLTNSDGLARFTLIEKMLNATGEHPVDPTIYVIATYELSTPELAGEAFWVNVIELGGINFTCFGKLNMTDIDETISREQLDKLREPCMYDYARLSKAATEPPDVEILLPNGTSIEVDVMGNDLWTIEKPYAVGGPLGSAAYLSMRDIILSYYDIFGQDIVYCIIKVRYRGAAMDEKFWEMTGNTQVTLTLGDFVIPEFPSFIIMPLFMIATLLAVIVYRRQLKKREMSVFQEETSRKQLLIYFTYVYEVHSTLW